jgi:spore coat protein H
VIKRNINLIIIAVILILFILAGPVMDIFRENQIVAVSTGMYMNKSGTSMDFIERGVNEDRGIYKNMDPVKIADMYVTIVKPSKGKDEKVATFNEMNRIGKEDNYSSPAFEIIIQEGNENGTVKGAFGYGTKKPNGVIELRGHSTREATQKSYQIKLYDSAGLWNEQKTINLNKHPYDLTRIRNKLSFDLFRSISDFTSLRTQFVRLHVKDLTSNPEGQGFVDYGLFTHVEQPNKRFLESHGLDPNGNLYKAEYFEFFRYTDNIKNVDDPGYSKEEFEKILEIRAGNDNKKLIRMLDDVNNMNLNINDVIEKHFDKENYLTWMAVNIITKNIDTNTQNFLLYSPLNSKKWYFLPWDYDGAWDDNHQTGKTIREYPDWEESGISNYWGAELHRRFLKNPENLTALIKKVEEIRKSITKDFVHKLLMSYYPIVSNVAKSAPDAGNLQASVDNYDKEFWRLEELPEINVKNFYKNLEKPMPVFLGDLHRENGKYELNWDYSYDFQGDDLKYDFDLAQDPEFKKTMIQNHGIKETRVTLDNLAPGTYYWRVLIIDSKGNSQIPFDTYKDEFKHGYFGVKKIVID